MVNTSVVVGTQIQVLEPMVQNPAINEIELKEFSTHNL
jgi:hypothetical protein